MIKANHLTVRHFVKKQKLTFPQLRGDTAIVQYPGDNGTALCAMAMEAEGKRLFIEVDDNYSVYGDELWMKRAQWGRTIGEAETSIKGHRWIVEHSHGVIVTTRALKGEYLELNDNVHVCRNSIHPGDWPSPAQADDDVFRIGWYASNSHDRDAVMVRRALSWASRQPHVEVVNIGHDPGWSFRRRQIGWTDNFLAQRKELCRLDVGVAPLVASPLAKYRSDLKALEYSMAGALPILQSSEPYWEWDEKPFAWTCHTAGDWEEAIRWAVSNRDEVRAMSRAARNYVLAERAFSTEINKWKEAISARA